jgi:hypothetical protein
MNNIINHRHRHRRALALANNRRRAREATRRERTLRTHPRWRSMRRAMRRAISMRRRAPF